MGPPRLLDDDGGGGPAFEEARRRRLSPTCARPPREDSSSSTESSSSFGLPPAVEPIDSPPGMLFAGVAAGGPMLLERPRGAPTGMEDGREP